MSDFNLMSVFFLMSTFLDKVGASKSYEKNGLFYLLELFFSNCVQQIQAKGQYF